MKKILAGYQYRHRPIKAGHQEQKNVMQSHTIDIATLTENKIRKCPSFKRMHQLPPHLAFTYFTLQLNIMAQMIHFHTPKLYVTNIPLNKDGILKRKLCLLKAYAVLKLLKEFRKQGLE